MKTLQLTIEQKQQLLDLCKLYFKEYDFVSWSLKEKDCIHLCKRVSQQKVDGSVFVGIYKSEHIPWLEMCLIHLPKLMFSQSITKYGTGNLQHHQIIMMMDDVHPVDYLLLQFKCGKK